jgi:hypothetical protein
MTAPLPDDDLTEFLTELAATTDMSPAEVDAAIAAYPDLRDAILRFSIDWHAHEFTLDNEEAQPLPVVDFTSYQQEAFVDPFQGKTLAELRSAAAACDIPLSLLSKLENRAIKVETIPLLLVRLLASTFGTEVSKLLGFLSLGPTLQAGAEYRADAPPEAAGQISFAQAVRSTPTMGEVQRKRWLDLSESNGEL